MPYRHKKIKKRISNSSRAKNQQRCRRRKSLLKKAYEYGVECDADVYVVLQIRDDGQIYTFNSSGQWLPSLQELDKNYPMPIHKTPRDFTDESKFLDFPQNGEWNTINWSFINRANLEIV